MVSRAERRALTRAEEARAEAEARLKSTAARTIDAEAVVRQEFETRLAALTGEMGEASRRATGAERELELIRHELAQVRLRAAEAGVELGEVSSDGSIGVAAVEMIRAEPVRSGGSEPGSNGGIDGAERLVQAVTSAALRMHAQAELDLVRARDQAIAVLRSATAQAEDLLTAAMATIERDVALAAATREQAERDSEAAATLRAASTSRLSEVDAECERLRTQARAEATGIVEAAQREAAEAMADLRRHLSAELRALRQAMDCTRDSFESFLDAPPEPTGNRRPTGTSMPTGNPMPIVDPIPPTDPAPPTDPMPPTDPAPNPALSVPET